MFLQNTILSCAFPLTYGKSFDCCGSKIVGHIIPLNKKFLTHRKHNASTLNACRWVIFREVMAV